MPPSLCCGCVLILHFFCAGGGGEGGAVAIFLFRPGPCLVPLVRGVKSSDIDSDRPR